MTDHITSEYNRQEDILSTYTYTSTPIPPDIRLDRVAFSYAHPDTGSITALNDVSLILERGMYGALLGRNGSGKSTMAKLIDVLELPDSGTVSIMGMDTAMDPFFWQIRRSCGMVFQNPDNQIVGTTVEEDVAFGPENLGVPSPEIRIRVDQALSYVDLLEYAKKQPSELSGGQKQKLAIAGILAMRPQILILDESTSMLDPVSRDEFLQVVNRLVMEKKMTVLHITHDMSEACLSDYIFVLDQGQLALSGTPEQVFSQVEKVRKLGLDVPVFADLAYELSQILKVPLDHDTLFSKKLALAGIIQMLSVADFSRVSGFEEASWDTSPDRASDIVMEVTDLCHTYDSKGESALKNVSFSVRRGEIFAIIGHSGSGKTTLITHLNGLLRPQQGQVLVYPDKDSKLCLDTRKNDNVKQIRHVVGLLFQYPEYQLFEETVQKDIAFGPTKMGLDKDEIYGRVLKSLELVGLDDTYLQRSPFELSGGQKRRVAFAGVLAMDPDILVLDEPAAGLDPVGRREILHYAKVLKEQGKTIILVSHNMDEAAEYSDRILVLKNGAVQGLMTPAELFADPDQVATMGLCQPEIMTCLLELKKDYPAIEPIYFNTTLAAKEVVRGAIIKQCQQGQGNQEGINGFSGELI